MSTRVHDKMDDVCTPVRFAMDQLGVSTSRRRLFTTLFEAMTVSLFCQRGTGKRCAMPCCSSCSTIFERETPRSSIVVCVSPLVSLMMDQVIASTHGRV